MLIFIFVLIIYTNPKIWKFWVSYISHRRQGLVWNVTQTRESWKVAQIATFSIFLSFLPFLHQRFRAHGHKNGTSLCYSDGQKWSAWWRECQTDVARWCWNAQLCFFLITNCFFVFVRYCPAGSDGCGGDQLPLPLLSHTLRLLVQFLLGFIPFGQ